MAISMVGTPESLFNILGKCAAVIKNLRTYQDAQLAALVNPGTGIVAGLNDEPDVQAITGAGYISALTGSGGSVGPLMQQQAAAIVNRLVFRDAPRLGQTLTVNSTLASLQEVIRQMKAGGFTVRRCTVTGGSVQFDTPAVGDAVVVSSTVRPFDGLPLENLLEERVNIVCDADSYVGGATQFQESLRITGTGAESDVFAFDWPLGSDATTNVNCIDGASDASGGNLLTNSDWEDWTSGEPDNWSVLAGVAGVDFIQDTGNMFRGSSCLKLIGTAGAVLTAFSQEFGDSTAGTSGTLQAVQQYSKCVWLRRGAAVLASGTLRVSLVDGNGNVVEDQAGTPNVQDFDLTTLTTNYAPFIATFRTPLALPETLAVKYELTAAIPNGREVYVDLCSMGIMTQFYTSGEFWAAHSGQVPNVINDQASLQISNGRGAGGTLDTWQTVWSRLFVETIPNELLLPSSNTPNISDSLIG